MIRRAHGTVYRRNMHVFEPFSNPTLPPSSLQVYESEMWRFNDPFT